MGDTLVEKNDKLGESNTRKVKSYGFNLGCYILVSSEIP
jgi:hypothetical protein